MKSEHELSEAGTPVGAASEPQYATRVEVEAALNGLTDDDYSKLVKLARCHCRQRRLPSGACEPDELLNQAVLKTLECDDGKRWNKRISIVRHLDRAMENISGHLVKERMKIVAFPDGLSPENDEPQTLPSSDGMADADNVSALLWSIFGKDDLARQVFVMRAEGSSPRDVQARLSIASHEYETTNRRILRKISKFLTSSDK